jgi:hypothetical protein
MPLKQEAFECGHGGASQRGFPSERRGKNAFRFMRNGTIDFYMVLVEWMNEKNERRRK